jgi:hypothetical protein
MAFGAHQALHALADAHDIIGEDEQRGPRIAVGMIVRRHLVAGVGRQQREPFLELPLVQ